MRTETGQPVRLDDYAPTPYAVEAVELDVRLHPTGTEVVSRVRYARRPATAAGTPLVLDGDGLALVWAGLDGTPLSPDAYRSRPDRFELSRPPEGPFTLEIGTRIDPESNTQLMGLYRSGGNYCTQCEAEGFRRITYFQDRPDVLARYTVRIEADAAEAPVLLSNGNLVRSGALPDGRHFAVWHDPFPKPSYLFALVAGRLAEVSDTFVTASGRSVALRIFVEPGKEDRAGYAMDALKRSMRWDEEAFGREYDLDVFMIVAVSDFNMGAMENKGLNVFNDRYVLADPATATDQDYASIEAIIAHEYFHNWTGNRITCRDWFQLCLKEGLTVFRDQEFTSDQRSRPVKRISDVRLLRNHQFQEDAGPLAHPVRPSLYHEISNFYTATVYEKGAEVVRVIRTLIGAEAFRRGMDIFFERFDGQAVTVEDFLSAFSEATGEDLSGVMAWYRQAGTPRLVADEAWDPATGTFSLAFAQSTPPTPGEKRKGPVPIPVRFALLSAEGRAMPVAAVSGAEIRGDVIVLTDAEATVRFEGLPERPVASLLRGFSAPVVLSGSAVAGKEAFLIARDDDPFNRWEAAQGLARRWLVAHVRGGATPNEAAADLDALVAGLSAVLSDESLDAAFRALALQVPGEQDLLGILGEAVDLDAVLAAIRRLKSHLGERLGADLAAAYRGSVTPGPYSPDAASAGRRSLRATALDLLVAGGGEGANRLARAHYDGASNMTDRFAALSIIVSEGLADREAVLDDFYRRFSDDPLVLDKWFAVQARAPRPDTLDRVLALLEHPKFSLRNPNRVRALVGTFAHQNLTQFNRADGAGYRFVADRVIALDPLNPQVAARLLSSFRAFRTMEPKRRDLARAALERVATSGDLSSDTRDIVGRMLA